MEQLFKKNISFKEFLRCLFFYCCCSRCCCCCCCRCCCCCCCCCCWRQRSKAPIEDVAAIADPEDHEDNEDEHKFHEFEDEMFIQNIFCLERHLNNEVASAL